MKENNQEIHQMLDEYGEFNDGLLVSFGFDYENKSNLSAKIVLEGRNNNFEWKRIEISIDNIEEFFSKRIGNEFNSISSGVKLINFGKFFCIDIDGVYDFAMDPTSIDEIRKYGECYVIGSEYSKIAFKIIS